jgi:hypothetical protein
MRMIYHLQFDDGVIVCISGIKGNTLETQAKKHEDMKHTLELQVRESPWSGWQGQKSLPDSDQPSSRPTTRLPDLTFCSQPIFILESLLLAATPRCFHQPSTMPSCLLARILD